MVDYYFRTESGKTLEAPSGKHLEIFKEVLRPSPNVKQIDVCCGRGFGKTLLAVQIAAIVLEKDPDACGLFLEPDWDRVHSIFLREWIKWIPAELYTLKIGDNCIIWHNGAPLYFKPRVITGSKELARHRGRGFNPSFVIDDETAVGFDLEQFQNLFASLRADSPIRFYLTLSTPLVGSYGRFINRGGNVLFRGKSSENTPLLKRDPTYVDRLRATMSADQARRELDGELVALEGRIWKTAVMDKAWPAGNIDEEWPRYNPREPWWLFCDLGGATGAYSVVQYRDAIHRGRELWRDGVWVAVADLCPTDDASASRAFQRLKTEFGTPAGVVAGRDVNTVDRGDGRTVSYFVEQVFGPSVRVYPCDERRHNRQIQYDRLSYLICSALGERRFTVARHFVALDDRSKRGIREMIDEDAWPSEDKRRPNDFLPKNKDNVVQHIRDALMMGASMVMSPPDWNYSEDHAA